MYMPLYKEGQSQQAHSARGRLGMRGYPNKAGVITKPTAGVFVDKTIN